MAKRKEYRYNPVDFKKDVAIGIVLPFGKINGLFKQSYTTEEQSISNLKNLLLTRKGERPFQPEFGSDIYSLMFEPIESGFDDSLQTSLRNDIKYWLPYIVINDIIVDSVPDRNYVSISLTFKVTLDGANQQIILFLDSAGVGTIQ
jgi:phage baseplate assembly protein W